MAYTKYSLTPADNNAAPPNGAPEGMLPSAVNDTMRDMMSQIRDVGDGIRGGTYTMTAPVITGGSINGTTIGATTRSTGAFTTLASNGATTFTAGTASTSTTTGTAVITGGLGVSGRINAANFDGIVGANTAAAGNFTTLGATGVATFSAGTVSAPAITTTGDTNTGIFFPAADTIAFTEGGVESMRITSAGNVGIGTNSPNARLELAKTSGVSLRLNDLSTNYWEINNNSNLIFNRGGTEYMRIDSSGNVGIGTSSPAFALDLGTADANMRIAPSAPTNNALTRYTNTGGTGFVGLDSSVGGLGAAYGLNLYHTGAYPIVMSTNNTERMRIDSSGVLLVACTALPTGGVGGISLSSPATSNGMLLGTTGTGATNMIRFYNPNGNVGAITTSGSLTTYAVSSDYRLKENLASLENAKEFILSLKPKQGNWKADGSKFVGFVAHEFAQTSPTSVIGEKDAVDEEGKPVYQSMQASSAEVMANLVALVQEQQAMIENLTTRLNALEGK
jgi:hypothetical protein